MIISLYPDMNYFLEPCDDIEELSDDASLKEIKQRLLFDSLNPEMDLYLPLTHRAWYQISDAELLDKFIVHLNNDDKELSRKLLIYDISEETLSLLMLMYGGAGESN